MAQQIARNLVADESRADIAGQDKAKPPVQHLLVLPHQRDQRRIIGQIARNLRQARGHPHLPQMLGHPRWRLLAAQPHPRRQIEGQRAADRHPLAMQQPAGISGRGFQRVSEGVAQVQKRALTLLGLVAADDGGLHRHRMGHRVLPCRRIGSQPRRIRFEPGEEIRVPQQPVFRHLAIAGQKIARLQAVQQRDIGQDQRRLVEGADQVLAMGGVDTGLAADTAVDLRQQRRRDLDEAHSAPKDRGRETHQIADHAAAERDHHIASFDPVFQQPFHHAGQVRPAFGALARRQHQRLAGDARRRERVAKRRQVQARDIFVGDDGQTRADQQRRDLGPRASDQTRADAHLVGTRAQRHMNGNRVFGDSHFVSCKRSASAWRIACNSRVADCSMLSPERTRKSRSAIA